MKKTTGNNVKLSSQMALREEIMHKMITSFKLEGIDISSPKAFVALEKVNTKLYEGIRDENTLLKDHLPAKPMGMEIGDLSDGRHRK